MLTRSLLAVACALALAAPSFADDAHHPGEQAKPAASMPAGKMPEMMSRMQEQMTQIQAASDPQERRRLIDEHVKTMHEAMPMMAGMGDGAAATAGAGQMPMMMEDCMGMMKHPKMLQSAPR